MKTLNDPDQHGFTPLGLTEKERLALVEEAVADLKHITVNETAAWNTWNYIATSGPIRDALLAFMKDAEDQKTEENASENSSSS